MPPVFFVVSVFETLIAFHSPNNQCGQPQLGWLWDRHESQKTGQFLSPEPPWKPQIITKAKCSFKCTWSFSRFRGVTARSIPTKVNSSVHTCVMQWINHIAFPACRHVTFPAWHLPWCVAPCAGFSFYCFFLKFPPCGFDTSLWESNVATQMEFKTNLRPE